MFDRFLLAVLVASVAGIASAQDASILPEACRTGDGATAMEGQKPEMQMPAGAGQATEGYMRAMQAMQGPMMQAIIIEDPDLAFACGMIPHHQAAIDMARTVQESGSDPQIREMSQKTMDAQAKEIEELTAYDRGTLGAVDPAREGALRRGFLSRFGRTAVGAYSATVRMMRWVSGWIAAANLSREDRAFPR